MSDLAASPRQGGVPWLNTSAHGDASDTPRLTSETR